MTDPLTLSDAERFASMAERIRHNQDSSTFGGAWVIIPPGEGGIPMETLILDSKGDPAQFYMLLMAKSKNALDELQTKERMRQGYGQR